MVSIEEYKKFYNSLPEEERANYNEPELVLEVETQVDRAEREQMLRQNLNDTDYVVLKLMEGAATEEEYADILEQRKQWRKEINDLMEVK